MASRRQLGEILIGESVVTREVVEGALRMQKHGTRGRLGQLLVDSGAMDPGWLTAALAEQAGVDTVDPLMLAVDPTWLWRVPPDVAERLGAFVAKDEDGLLLVLADPSQTSTVRTVSSLLGVSGLRVAAGLPDRVTCAIARHYDTLPARKLRVRGVVGEQRPILLSATGLELDVRGMHARLARNGPRTWSDFATALVVYAVETGAERLVIDQGRVRLTWDGVEGDVMELPASHALGVVARLRVLVHLDAGAIKGEAGAARVIIGESEFVVDRRMSPGQSGGRLELRLEPGHAASDRGMAPKVAAAWKSLTGAPGLVVLAGPDGAGLEHTAGAVPNARVHRLEDGASVGAAVAAAAAGVTVLGCVAAAGVPEALARLRELAPSRSSLAAVLTGALAQRRVRKVCQKCSVVGEPDAAAAERFGVVPFAAPRAGEGCPACFYRRYVGSFYAYEVVLADAALRDAFDAGAALSELGRRCAPVAERPLQVDAVSRGILGETAIEELYRVIPPRPAWSTPSEGERHRGLLRAVTDAPLGADEVVKATLPALPALVWVDGGNAGTGRLRAALAGAVDVQLVASTALARASSPPRVGVLSKHAPGGWDAVLIQEWRAAGTHVVLVGAPLDYRQMNQAFALGADDYAGGVEDLLVRVSRWVPVETGEMTDDEITYDTLDEVFVGG
ncbi:hypothetical protein LBMAG42_26210 [Deltaproteobacteria bacterium]|nr:hypothetical protein LBMAG42_26210 [Deltaproteobacteria bacterium]